VVDAPLTLGYNLWHTMRYVIASVIVAVLGAACEGNPSAPSAPPPSAPEAPPPPLPLPAAPRAVLSVGRGDVNPPLGIVNFTRVLFDGSRSEGDGLTYLLEFGDGASSTEPVATRSLAAPSPYGSDWLLTARLTVTDRHGRSDSTTQQYFVATVHTGSGTFWANILSPTSRRPVSRKLVLTQNGTTLSGWYAGPETQFQRVTGMLTDERTIRLRTENGAIEFTGVHGWREEDDNQRLVLRLSMRGGMADGALLDFDYVDPY
jgi:hypothetical protein